MEQKPSRRQAREWAVQMLTAADLNPPEDVTKFIMDSWVQLASVDEMIERTSPSVTKLKVFAEERVVGVLTNLKALDEIIKPLLDGWELYRLGTVERAVIRMGIWEIDHTDVPPPVVINEAVDLANWFSTPKSRTIVNGVLDRYSHSRG